MGDNGKWQIAFWLLTVLTIASFSWTTFCHWDNATRIETTQTKLLDLKDVANDCMHKIDKRLSRIEEKLGIKD